MLKGLIKALTGQDNRSPGRLARLAGRLANYPAWHMPHLGTNGAYPDVPAPRLTEAEHRANLHAYIAAMPERVAVLRALLGEFGLEADRAYDEAGRADFIRQLHLWLLQELPATFRADLAQFPVWEPSDRSGPQIVFSLLGDIAMLFADVLLKAWPGCFLGMNLDPRDRDATSYGRPCVLGLSDKLFPGTGHLMTYDFEEQMFDVYRRMDRPQIAFTSPDHLANGPASRMMGFALLEACERYRVEPDLPERRAKGWMAKAV